MVERFDVFLINLDEDVSDNPKITRPGVIISPDEMNRHTEHVLIAPLSSTTAKFPTRVPTQFLDAERFIILDQIKAVDKTRLTKKIGTVEEHSAAKALEVLQELFSE